MATFKETREVLLASYACGIITDEEFSLLFEENSSSNLDFPYDNYPPFNLESQSEAECRANFRVEKHHIPLVEDVLQIPQFFVCDQGTVCEGTEGLCMLLKRYAFPCRYSDMIPIFGRPVPELCMINNTVTDWIYAHHSHRITQWNQTIVVRKMVILGTTSNYQNCIKSTNKIPHYAREYKKEYLYIRGLNKEFKYFKNKMDSLNHGLFESPIADRIKYNMKRFLRAQEKGKLNDISGLMLPNDITYNLNLINKYFELYKLRYDAFCDDDFVYGNDSDDSDDDSDDGNGEYLVDGKPYPGFIEFYDIFKNIYNQIKNEDSDSDSDCDSDSEFEDFNIILPDSDDDSDSDNF